MNFLAHLWLADRAELPLAGAILGDYFRGALPDDLPAPLAQSVQLHRRIDANTDRHPVVQAARSAFGNGPRRYAGILLDILFDHALALDWTQYSDEPLPAFADRAAQAVAAESAWFERAGGPAPARAPFSALLVSYRSEPALERAIERTAGRMRRPQGLIDAMAGWRSHMPQLRRDLPVLLGDLRSLDALRPKS
jgi:acyl carrier protein phosphodiesterase